MRILVRWTCATNWNLLRLLGEIRGNNRNSCENYNKIAIMKGTKVQNPQHKLDKFRYINLATSEAVSVADEAGKKAKYTHLEASYYFMPVAVESLGAFGPGAQSFLRDLSRHLILATGEPLAHHHLQQWIAVAVQRRNIAWPS